MNLHLFAGFLLITVVLLLTPGPIVTLGDLDRRNAWRARRTGDGRRYLALATPCCWRRSRSALSLLLGHAVYLFELLRWAGAAYLFSRGVVESEDPGILHRLPAAVRGPHAPGRASAGGDVRTHGTAGGVCATPAGRSHQALERRGSFLRRARATPRACIRPNADRWRNLAVARAAARVRLSAGRPREAE